jgi:hypothetical protein
VLMLSSEHIDRIRNRITLLEDIAAMSSGKCAST